VVIKIGGTIRTITLSDSMEERRVTFDLPREAVSKIEIMPPVPVSPFELGVDGDLRKLGVGLEQIWFERPLS
jgi:hypothetical protein